MSPPTNPVRLFQILTNRLRPAGENNPLFVNSLSKKYSQKEGAWIDAEVGCCGVHLCADAVAATTGYVMIDLSDTNRFPHNAGSAVYLTEYQISIHPTNNFVGQVLIGFISRINNTNAHFRPVVCWYPINLVPISQFGSFADGAQRMTTARFLVPGNATDATFQADTALASPADNTVPYSTIPGLNDVVMKIVVSGGVVSVGATLKYYVK